MKTKNKTEGFTIIEVVLVLAIAALIFLMVFIALPALQKSQRDTQRKQDVARISTQITNYSSANRGKIPTDLTATTGTPAQSFVQRYLGGTTANTGGPQYQDPGTGNGYIFQAVGTQATAAGQVGYKPSALCGDDGAFTSTSNTRQYAVEIYLEGTSAPYCVDNRG